MPPSGASRASGSAARPAVAPRGRTGLHALALPPRVEQRLGARAPLGGRGRVAGDAERSRDVRVSSVASGSAAADSSSNAIAYASRVHAHPISARAGDSTLRNAEGKRAPG